MNSRPELKGNMSRYVIVGNEGGDWTQIWDRESASDKPLLEGHSISAHEFIDQIGELYGSVEVPDGEFGDDHLPQGIEQAIKLAEGESN